MSVLNSSRTEMENLRELKFTKICRVCLRESDQMYSIYSELYEDQHQLSDESPCIYEILASISSMKVKINDGLPSMICSKCINLVHISFKFQRQCNHSQEILDVYLKQIGDSSNNLKKHVETHIGIEEDDDGVEPQEFLLINKTVEEPPCIEEVEPVEKCASAVNEKYHVCPYCDKSYKYASSLKVHLRNHTKETPYTCTICSKSFKLRGSLIYHKRSHTGEQPYACKICGNRYRQSSTLTAHMRIHTGQRPFLCSICGKGFRQASDLGYHMRSHTKEKPYMCNICGKTMSMQCHLVHHMRTHTGERPYKCGLCEKAFPSSSRLKRHEIIHTALKPYSCDVCFKSFNRSSSLKVHSKIHKDERTHLCPICNRGFIQGHALKSHIASHSSEISRDPLQI